MQQKQERFMPMGINFTLPWERMDSMHPVV